MKALLFSACVVALCACPSPLTHVPDGLSPLDAGQGGSGGSGGSGGGAGGGSGGAAGSAGGSGGASAVCGDGALGGVETCDDGNIIGGDGCTGACIVELGYQCSGHPSVCTPLCGDGRKFGNEACDDGNATAGDGCSATCTVETGYNCSGLPSSCTTVCGDGLKAGLEQCDDGNLVNGDGCTALCLIETGYVCPGGTVCTPSCGDGVKTAGEGCDDGNLISGDGCSAACAVEYGYTCVGSPSACSVRCGDGVKAPSEFCDDGFTDACGSCNADCTSFGNGFTCGDGVVCPEYEVCDDGNTLNTDACASGAGGFCEPARCGDGFVWLGHEGCDDGNTVSGDGCSSTCTVESTGAGALAFQKIPNIWVQDDVTRVVWHPSGRFAVLLGTSGKVIKYDAATRGLSVVQTLGTAVVDLDAAPDGGSFMVIGQTGSATTAVQRLWRVNVGFSDAGVSDTLLPALDAGTLPGTAAGIAVEPGSSRFAIVTRGATLGTNFLSLWSEATGLGAAKAYFSGGGALNLMWGSAALSAGSANVITSDGVNGADSNTWVLDTNTVTGNTFTNHGFGNPGCAAWQPGGQWGALCGFSSNKLYVFNGGWTLATLPVPTGASPNAMAFRADGNRALIVGRAIGTPLYGVVIDYRPTASGAFDSTALVDASIPNFDGTPWFGNSNMQLMDVAFRPGTACDEGLIVGSDNGTQFSPSYGTVIRFYDPTNPGCSP